jgi:hypothetical protein
VFDGVVGLVEGDGAGAELLRTAGETQDGVGERVVEGLLYVELQNLLVPLFVVGREVVDEFILCEVGELFL